MSLPKEPRQLMINLMYLVLTAILALNVSAEILNAFLSMDESLQESTQIIGRSNEILLKSIRDQAEAYPQFKSFHDQAINVQEYTKSFCNYVEAMKTNLVERSGGMDEENMPVGMKDKDITTLLFVEEGEGNLLRDSVLALRTQLLNLVPDTARAIVEENMPLGIPEIPEDSDKKDWADYTFRQMPVAAVLPLLTKFQSDAKVAETSLLNYLAGKISAKPVHDEYEALIAADKSYVIVGEELNAEIFLGAYSSTTDNISVRVNGRAVPVRNGKAIFSNQAGSIGTHDLNVEIKARDPRTNKVTSYTRKFTYEVGERSVTTSADKMNVFYLGVENPLSVSAAGVASGEVQVSGTGGDISKASNGKYIVKPRRPGNATITVSGGGLSPTKFEYRVKAIPTPIARLGDKNSGIMKPNVFKAYNKVYPHLDNFDFEAKCNLIGFELVRVDKHGDVFDSQNRGGTYSEKTRRLVNAAKFGDTFYFDKIKAKCPGDQSSRKLNGLVFRIQ